MPLTLQAAVLAKRRAMNYDFQKPHTRRLIRTLFEILSQQKGAPDLQIREFDNLTSTVQVLADAPCRVYALVLTKETAATNFTKADDSATAVSGTAPMFQVEMNETKKEVAFIWPDGWTQATGFSIAAHNEADSATPTSPAAGDGPRGFAIIGG